MLNPMETGNHYDNVHTAIHSWSVDTKCNKEAWCLACYTVRQAFCNQSQFWWVNRCSLSGSRCLMKQISILLCFKISPLCVHTSQCRYIQRRTKDHHRKQWCLKPSLSNSHQTLDQYPVYVKVINAFYKCLSSTMK